MAIRIVLAEDEYLVREGLRHLLETQDDLEVVAACGDLDALTFEIESDDAGSDASLEPLRDRVEALGGAFDVTSTAGGRRRVSGSLPVGR